MSEGVLSDVDLSRAPTPTPLSVPPHIPTGAPAPAIVPFRHGDQNKIPIRMDYTATPRELGSGAFGDVIQVTGNPGDKEFALKNIDVTIKGRLESALTEWNILHLASHPNIVKPITMAHNMYYTGIRIAMPVIKATLFDFMDPNNALAEAEIREIAWQILSALDYLHGNRIIHRDVKPNNILGYKNSLEFVLVDFGLAKHVYGVGQGSSRARISNIHYRAPEVYEAEELWSKNQPYTPPSFGVDIWALGICLLELFIQDSLFPDDYTQDKIRHAIDIGMMEKSVDALTNASNQAKDVLRGMLRYNPQDRYTAAQAMNSEWFDDKSYVPPETMGYPHFAMNEKQEQRWIDFAARSDLAIERYTKLGGFNETTQAYAKRLRNYLFRIDTWNVLERLKALSPGNELLLALHLALVFMAAYQMQEESYYAYLRSTVGKPNSLTLNHLSNTPGFPSLRLVLEMFKIMGYNIIVL